MMGLSCEAKGVRARKWNDFVESFEMGARDKLLLIALALLTCVTICVRFGLGLGLALVGFPK